MAKKEDLFGKLNMKDYNNELEEVLETKNFSSDTKNFLLSMLYKVEIAYNDYYIVKSLTKTKGEFIQEIIDIIHYDCDSIELIKPLDEKYEGLIKKIGMCIVDKSKKEIISIYNEQVLLYAIFKLHDMDYKFENIDIKKPLQELLNFGKSIHAKEVIRDFDGWAWHTNVKSIEDIECNIIFQNLVMLIGEEILTDKQIKESLSNVFQSEKANKLYVLICKIAVIIYLKNNEEKKADYKILKKNNQEKLNQMEDKVNYLKGVSEQRKKVEIRIKNIDKCLTDVSFLKKEFVKTNKKLKEDEKIFSISDFAEVIQNEKKQLICELQKYNIKMMPESYMKEKQALKETLSVLEVLEENEDIYTYILEVQKLFIEGLQEKINKIQTRKDAMDLIYKFRYYLFLPYKDIEIKNVKELQKSILKTEKMIYNIACKMNVINQISINENVNNEVISKILDTKIVELENIELLFKAENYQIVLNIFDEENVEKILEYDTIEGLTARMNKKFRLFIK